MALTKERIRYLLDVYFAKKATDTEQKELMDWILETEEDAELKAYALEIWDEYQATEDFSYVNWDQIYARSIRSPLIATKQKERPRRWVRFAAAATILVVLSLGAYLYFPHSGKDSIATITTIQSDIVAPTGNRAVLILSDGTKIELDRRSNGEVAKQGKVQIIKKSSEEISYSGTAGGKMTYNTLLVPKGSKPISLVLADNSKIWIDVGSSLTYPTAFTGHERRVKISGEAYFEVVHNENMPFIVQNGNLIIRDIGTHFNVNTYADEPAQRITLLEGAVRIQNNQHSQLLKPGQQASIKQTGHGNIHVTSDVNLNAVMAWKKGKFSFDKSVDIGTIMRQISRWYNVDIEYQGKVDQRFWGSISKDVNVSQVLKILEATGDVKFKLTDKKIIVIPVSH